jgi:hypothetical protein
VDLSDFHTNSTKSTIGCLESVIASELEGNRRDCNTIEKQRGRR